ncbi:MAG: sigma-70 family RNA polymerase sigma factor [Candidatus Krumholzibacteria bacterium]|nr:sigma-70 family RNA polymerase sigma factor [Candidatus Krumholzibacteria bacterium]
MADDRSDEQLMMDVRAGDIDAFGVLVERHHQRALNVAYRLSGDADTSQDVAQESFLRILRHARRYKPRAQFTTFLYTVVRNVVLEMARRKHRRVEVPLSTAADSATAVELSHEPSAIASVTTGISARAEPPDVLLERREMQQRLRTALMELPDELRDAFVLSEIEGLRYREIADICGCPEGTVASRKHKAVEQLRQLLSLPNPPENE